MKGGFESTVILPGFRSGIVSPKTQRASFSNITSDRSKALDQYYELIANTKKCLPDWKQLDPNRSRQLRVQPLDAPIVFIFIRRDETVISIKHRKVLTDNYMVDISIHAADSGVRPLDTTDEVPLALAFTDTDADKEYVCQDFKALVAASHQSFTSIVGKPGMMSGYFEASIKISGFPSISVRRREEAYMTFNAQDLSEVEALNDRLVGILTKCFPAWTATEIDPRSGYDQTTRRFRLTESEGSVFELSYDSEYDASIHTLDLHLYPPGAAPRIR